MFTKLTVTLIFSDRTITRTLDYPVENVVQVKFEDTQKNIIVEEIKINGITANPYYNTSFKFANSDVTLTSVHSIEKDGVFSLELDDLYIRSHRSSNWHCSSTKKDFVFNYEFTRSSFTDRYRDRNHIGFDNAFIPCFGCSFTYGEGQSDTETWPYLLANKTGKRFLNLGVCGSGIDAIYNNLKLLHSKHKFGQTVILFPNCERRIVRAKIEDVWFRAFSSVDIFNTSNPYHFYADSKLRQRYNIVQKNIVKDIDNRYSKRIIGKIIRHCEDNNITLFCSSHNNDVYEYLKTQNCGLLPRFPELAMFAERADDGGHPHRKHYQYFVDQIADLVI